MFGNMFSFARTKVAAGVSVWHDITICGCGSMSTSLTQGARGVSGQKAIRPKLRIYLSQSIVGLGRYNRQPTDTASNGASHRLK